MPATIKDVAERAGCSIATVSRFVNGLGPIAVETRNRIEAAITALGYRPSEMGRSLRRQASQTIGVIVPSFTNPVFAASVSGIQAVARERGYGVLVASTDYDVRHEAAAVETFLGQRVDGLVLTVCDAMSSPALSILDAEAKAHVLLYNQADRAGRLAVTVDNVAAARAMTEAILLQGHRRIAFLAGRFSASDRSRQRYRGFADALATAGLTPPAPIEVGFLAEALDDAIAALLGSETRPTALFCSNDVLALAAIGALRRSGLQAPADISVVGFDGVALAPLVEPPLATVNQPSRRMGERAVEILLARIGGAPLHATPYEPFELRLGGTLAAMAPTERREKRSTRGDDT
ncbi:MAG: LacI family DNA-binding transcriptional regulator [Beijerinckiaceae bacterium]